MKQEENAVSKQWHERFARERLPVAWARLASLRADLAGVPANAMEYHRPRAGRPCHGRRPGFSFTEILFAVMILGIGFIMVAAVFPVAIKETQETVEETTAASVAHAAASDLQRFAINANFPVTNGKVVCYGLNPGPAVTNPDNPSGNIPLVPPTVNPPPFWLAVSGNMILSTDTRFGWVPFYSRGASAAGVANAYAQVTIIAVQCRNQSTFTVNDTAALGGATAATGIANLQGRPATGTFTLGTVVSNVLQPDTIMFSSTAAPASPGNPPGPANPGAVPTSGGGNVTEGCYLIVADDSAAQAAQMASSSPPSPPGSCNGYVYRIGAPRPDLSLTTWELLPGGDMQSSRLRPTGAPVSVFIVGRGYTDPTAGNTVPNGPAMDIAAYSTFIQIH